MAGFDTIADRVGELLDDRSVREEVSRARRSSRDAWRRTQGKKRKRQAISDPLIRQRVRETVQAGWEVAAIAREGPARRRRRRRRRGLALLLVAGGAVAMAIQRRTST